MDVKWDGTHACELVTSLGGEVVSTPFTDDLFHPICHLSLGNRNSLFWIPDLHQEFLYRDSIKRGSDV
jgi:hypothetical protein